jgi:hypothetical protein
VTSSAIFKARRAKAETLERIASKVEMAAEG